ncbi:hypothetical protein [Spirosoma pomorum]
MVILFNSGINPYVDYNSFLRGVAGILAGQESEVPAFPDRVLPIGVGFILMLFIGIAVQRLLGGRKWRQAYYQRAVWL